MKMKKFDKEIAAVKALINENLQDVERILSDVAPEKAFWFCNGIIVKNLQDMPKVLNSIDEKTFAYHVNNEKNDIARWIYDVIQDEALAKSIEKLKKKSTMSRRIQGRIEYLNNIKESLRDL
ncbi:MAG: hypothetical protein QXY62_04820 [Candidatus Altiarchaeota archaeon]